MGFADLGQDFTSGENAATNAFQAANTAKYQQGSLALQGQALMANRMQYFTELFNKNNADALSHANDVFKAAQTKAQALSAKGDDAGAAQAIQAGTDYVNHIGQMQTRMAGMISQFSPLVNPDSVAQTFQAITQGPSIGQQQDVAAAGAGKTAGAQEGAKQGAILANAGPIAAAQADAKNQSDLTYAGPISKARAEGTAAGAPQSDVGKLSTDLKNGTITKEQFDADLMSKGILTGPIAQAVQSGATGDKLLAQLPPSLASQVKAYAEGRLQFPTGYALKSPYMQQILALVSSYDPQFDATNYQSRSALRTAFTSGSQSQNVNGIATAVGHLHDLINSVDQLENSNYPMANRVGNWILQNKGDPRVAEFLANREAITSELTRAWRGAGGAEADIQGWKDAIDQAGSPSAIKGVVGKIAHLLDSKANALNMQFNNGMGNNVASGRPPVDLIGPQARQTMEHLKSYLTAPKSNGAWRLVH